MKDIIHRGMFIRVRFYCLMCYDGRHSAAHLFSSSNDGVDLLSRTIRTPQPYVRFVIRQSLATTVVLTVPLSK